MDRNSIAQRGPWGVGGNLERGTGEFYGVRGSRYGSFSPDWGGRKDRVRKILAGAWESTVLVRAGGKAGDVR